MKKESEFFGQKLSIEEMKKVMGGMMQPPDDGTCKLSCGTPGNVSYCDSGKGDCQRDPDGKWIKCDGIEYLCPSSSN